VATHWGADSATSTLSTVPGQPLYDYVCAQRATPAFWLRYLCAIPSLSDGLTTAEVESLHGHGCAVGLVYNQTSAESVAGTYQDGWDDAQAAINLVAGLAQPLLSGVAVFVDIEAGWSPSRAYLEGWMANLRRALLLPGVYLPSNDPNVCAAYSAARTATPDQPCLLWSSEPEPPALWDTVQTGFAPDADYLGTWANDLALWQYSENSFKQYNGGLVDFNVATDAGLAALWQPAAPPAPPGPVRRTVIATCGLKPNPVHGGPNLATIFAGNQILQYPQRVEDWSLVEFRAQQGYILTANITDL
jgi:hypothetical protein